ncbi:MAG: Sapep family Mn(2+)-dependent dipeptidase [Clostridia bacterium]
MLKDLKKLIAIPSVSGEVDGEFPFGKPCHDALEQALEICKGYGFTTKKCGNYCGYAEIGSGEEIFGILVHLDVVPAGNGWEFDPYDVTVSDGRIYGRGVIDDKGPAIAVIHAMKDLAKLDLNKRVRLIFGTSEETGAGDDIAYYKEHEEPVTLGFTPDADFPVVYLEKGLAKVELSMPKNEVTYLKGGTAANMVPDSCEIKFMIHDKEYGALSCGKSAHGSMPHLGINAIGIAIEEAHKLARANDEYEVPFIWGYRKLFDKDYDGKRLGVDFYDEQSGGTTVNVGLIEKVDDIITITLDIRCPVSVTSDMLISAIKAKAEPLGFEVKLTEWVDSVHMDKDCDFIKTLMSAYQKVTGDMTEPLIMGGGTYAREMKNVVAFGPVFQGRECTEHQPNEYMLEEDFYKLKDIYFDAIKMTCSK